MRFVDAVFSMPRKVFGMLKDVYEGEVLGIAGESGSGKSTLAHAILRLINPPGQIVDGSIIFNGMDLTKMFFHFQKGNT